MKKFNVILVAMMLTASATNVFAGENPASEQSAEMLNKKPKKTTQHTTPFVKAEDDVLLVVSGEGANKDEATKMALRSAIEQAFGVFVSANTTILNDELVKDEIATIASGNIRHFEYLSETAHDDSYSVMLQAAVSIGKLVSYSKSKGSSAELAGATFAMNVKMEMLNEENERIAFENLKKELEPMFNNLFDYSIILGEPVRRKIQGRDWAAIPTKIEVVPNKNAVAFYETLMNFFKAIAKSTGENERGGKSMQICRGESIGVNRTVQRYNFRTTAIRDFARWIDKHIQTAAYYKIIDNTGREDVSCFSFGNYKYRPNRIGMMMYINDNTEMGNSILDYIVNYAQHRRFVHPDDLLTNEFEMNYFMENVGNVSSITVEPITVELK